MCPTTIYRLQSVKSNINNLTRKRLKVLKIKEIK